MMPRLPDHPPDYGSCVWGFAWGLEDLADQITEDTISVVQNSEDEPQRLRSIQLKLEKAQRLRQVVQLIANASTAELIPLEQSGCGSVKDLDTYTAIIEAIIEGPAPANLQELMQLWKRKEEHEAYNLLLSLQREELRLCKTVIANIIAKAHPLETLYRRASQRLQRKAETLNYHLDEAHDMINHFLWVCQEKPELMSEPMKDYEAE